MKRLSLLILLLLLPGCRTQKSLEPVVGAATTTGAYQEVPPITVLERKFIYTATFQNNATGKFITVTTTAEENRLGPKLDGHTLINRDVDTFDVTTTPVLQDKQYYYTGGYVTSTDGVTPLIKVKLPGQDPKVIQKKDLTKKKNNIANAQ